MVDGWCTLSYEILHVLSTLSLHSTKSSLLSLHFVYLNPRCHNISETREEIHKTSLYLSEVLHFVIKFLKSLMLQICIRVIIVCKHTFFVVYFPVGEANM